MALKIGLIRKRVERAVHRHGVMGTLAMTPRVAWDSLQRLSPGRRARRDSYMQREWQWDHNLDIDTRGRIHLAELDGCGENWVHGSTYEPVNPKKFHRMIGAVSLEHPQFTFVDIGSGKGRALVLATHYSFRRIVGVEFSADLNRIACQNIQKLGLSDRVITVCADALEYDIPPEPLVLYMFNPFDAKIMQPLIVRVEQSLQAAPRSIWIVYADAVHAKLWDSSPFFRRADEGLGLRPSAIWQSAIGDA